MRTQPALKSPDLIAGSHPNHFLDYFHLFEQKGSFGQSSHVLLIGSNLLHWLAHAFHARGWRTIPREHSVERIQKFGCSLAVNKTNLVIFDKSYKDNFISDFQKIVLNYLWNNPVSSTNHAKIILFQTSKSERFLFCFRERKHNHKQPLNYDQIDWSFKF